MKSITLLLGTYNDQPKGNLPEQFEQAYQRAYKPFLSLLNDFSSIRVVLHYSGTLLEWLEERHPEALMLIKDLIGRKQVELLGGGFYEPILSLIPDSDKLGQIEKLTTHLRATFGIHPRGSWIAERVWEPGLVKILKNCGLDYTFLDDSYFHIAGVDCDICCYPFLTEDQGKTIVIFPLHTSFYKLMVKTEPEELLKRIYSLADESGQRVVSLLVEGERLGLWNESYELCYEQEWLRRFFQALEDFRDRILTMRPRQYLRQSGEQIRGKIYIPCLAPEKMMQWVLNRDRQESFMNLGRRIRRRDSQIFLRGGYFRQFITKYPEINLLYSRMIYTHLQVNQIRGDKYRKQAARNELWKGQSNGVYWHGRFGGIYANHLRKYAYRSFIEAERITRSSEVFVPSIICTDYDLDGLEEYLYQSKVYNAYIHRQGACLIELDYLPVSWNYQDSMSRWMELCHQEFEESFDWYPRKSFLDHFFAPGTDIESFDRMSYRELGDFIGRPFAPVEWKSDQLELSLERLGTIQSEGQACPVLLRKRFTFHESGIELSLILFNHSEVPLVLWYGLEVNLALAWQRAESLGIPTNSGLGEEGSEVELFSGKQVGRALSDLIVRDLMNDVRLTISSGTSFDLWALPVETLTRSPTGFERIYQSSCLIPNWRFTLDPGQCWETKISLSLEKP